MILRLSSAWDDNACYYAEGGHHSGDDGGDNDNGYKSRCAKMDCHLENTEFKILGFFKHRK